MAVLLWLARRQGMQWGLTDFLLVGASAGSGFALLEATLRFAGAAGKAIPDGSGGFILATSIFPPQVAGPLPMLKAWLPPPVSSDAFSMLVGGGPGPNVHLVWSAFAALGLGLVSRGRGRLRWLGLLPLAYVSADHAVNNWAISGSTGGWAPLVKAMEHVRDALPVVVFVALIATVMLDRLTVTGPGSALAVRASGTERGGD